MEERRLATVSRPPQRPVAQTTLVDVRRDIVSSALDGKYNVNGKEGIGAGLARALAIEFHIQTEIVEYGKNKEKAWCKARGWIGDKSNPEKQAEAVVVYVFDHILQQLVFDAIEGGFYYPTTGERNNYGKLVKAKRVPKFEMGENGFPALTEGLAQFQIMANFLDKVKFAERTVASMAERNVILHILGKEDDGATESDKSASGAVIVKDEPLPPDELEICRNRIRQLLLKIHEGNKDLAIETFKTVAKELKVDIDIPANLKNLNDAKRILDEVTRLMQKPTVEVEEGDDPEIYGPVTAEEEERMRASDKQH